MGRFKDKNESKITLNNWHTILQEFMPSETMRAYLWDIAPNEFEIRDVIIGAPVSINKKAQWLNILALSDESIYRTHADAYKRAIEELKLKDNELFLLSERWYWEENSEEEYSHSYPFKTFEKAIERIKYEMSVDADDADPDYEPCRWFELEKWTPADDGSMANTYTYHLIGSEIIFFSENHLDKHGPYWLPKSYIYSSGSVNLNLPVPFKAGDLVTIDCMPFRHPLQTVILEVGDNRDCCCLQTLYRTVYGTWCAGAVKHGTLFQGGPPMLSPLYRIEYSDVLIESPLLDISRYINGSEKKGWKIWELTSGTEITDEELKRLIDGMSS